jgi:hypothetical protein
MMHGHEYTGESTAAPSVAAVDHASMQAMTVTGRASDQLRPPAIPLILRSPYVHTWQMGDQLVGDWPRHWTGAVTPLCGIARIDGVPYVFAGSPSVGDDGPSLAAMTQTGLTITATSTTFSFTSGGVALSVEFLSCVDLADLRRQSVPASYLLVRATSVDGAGHRVGVYVDVSGEWAHGDPATPITWGKHDVAGPARMVALTMEPATPTVFGESHNRASWGNTVLAADDRAGLTWEIGEDVLVRRTAATSDGLANAVDPAQPRPIEDRRPVLGVNQNQRSSTSTPSCHRCGGRTGPRGRTCSPGSGPISKRLAGERRSWTAGSSERPGQRPDPSSRRCVRSPFGRRSPAPNWSAVTAHHGHS